MDSQLPATEHRQRTRVPLSVPLIVTSLDSGVPFQGMCDSIDVSSSGVQLKLSRPLPTGTRLRLDILLSDRITEGRVVRSVRDGKKGWRVGIQLLEQTGNVWKVTAPPENWNPYRSASTRYDEWVWIG